LKFASTQNNFSNGELSPRLEGRNDLKEYFNGVATLQNFIPSREGGARRRPGTRIVDDGGGLDTDAETLYDFNISKDESYLISMRTYAVGAERHIFLEISRPALHPVTDNPYMIPSSLSSPYPTGVLPIFTADQIDGLDLNRFNIAQMNNYMFMTHVSGKLPPIVIHRTDTDVFRIAAYSDAVDDAGFDSALGSTYTSFNTTATTIAAVVTGVSPNLYTLTSSVALFTEKLVGARLKIRDGGTDRLYILTEYIDANNFYADSVADDAAVTAKTEWAFESWNMEYGYPQAVALYQNRLEFGGTKFEPAVIWFSVTGNLFIISSTKLQQDAAADNSGLGYFGAWAADNAFQKTMFSNKSNSIQWMVSGRRLQIGTTSAEHTLSTLDGQLDRDHATHTVLTFYGANDSTAIQVENSVIYANYGGKMLRELSYSEENGSNVSRLLSSLAEHLAYHEVNPLTTSLREVEFSKYIYQSSRGVIWSLTTEGALIGLTYETSTQSLAWHKHSIGGVDSKVLGMALISAIEGETEDLYLLVERTVDGSTVKYIEYIGEDFRLDITHGHYNPDGLDYPVYVDSMFKAAFFSAGTFTCTHLVNETVVIVVKGKLQSVETLTGGVIPVDDLTAIEGDVLVGLAYKSIIRSMKIQEGSRIGDAQVLIKRIDTALLTIQNSKIYKIGSHVGNMETRTLKDLDNDDLYTGEDSVKIDSSPGEEQRFYLETDSPYPLNISSIGIRGETQE